MPDTTQGQDEEVCSYLWKRGVPGRKVREQCKIYFFKAKAFHIFRNLIQGKRTVIRMLGNNNIFIIKAEGKVTFQLLLCSLSSSAGLPSTPSVSCSSWSLSMAAGLKHSLLLNTFSLWSQVNLFTDEASWISLLINIHYMTYKSVGMSYHNSCHPALL